MNHKIISTWGPKLLILILCLVGAFAAVQCGLIHWPMGTTAMAGGASVLHAIGVMGLPDGFSVAELTDAIEKLPLAPTKIGDSGLFEETGITTAYGSIDQVDGRISLVKATGRGDDPAPVKRDVRKVHIIPATHLALETVIKPDEFDSIRGFGTVTQPMAQAAYINQRQLALKNQLAVTREYQRMCALKGIVLDSDGAVLTDLYSLFGVTKLTQVMHLDVTTTDVRQQVMTALRKAELPLGGVVVNGWEAYCSASFFDALTGHETVKAAYANYQAAEGLRAGDVRKGFPYAGVIWREYNSAVSGKKFVDDGLAHLFPVARGLYKTYNAPADYMETVNTMGQAFYAKMEVRHMGKGFDLEAQSNPLTFCEYPESLVELSIS